MRIINRSELRMLLNGLPNPSKHDSPVKVEVQLPMLSLPNGEIIEAAKVYFLKIKTQNSYGQVKWCYCYAGPMPYYDDEIVIDRKPGEILEPIQSGILTP